MGLLIDLLFGWLLVTSMMTLAIKRVFKGTQFTAEDDEIRRVISLHLGAVVGALTVANYGLALTMLDRLT